ncbi:MAG: MBL fold metallo-hydrolase [Parasporobacterium sp.]|nr:MBL fold metallo-hydrolase [Parasporobacterium sp.]
MRIEWYGQACFRLESNGSSLVIDPYQDPEGLLHFPKLDITADRVLVTHEHFDHNNRDAVHLTGKSCELSVRYLEAFHDNAQGRILGSNKVFIVSDGKIKVVHLGDLGHRLSGQDLEQVYGCDVLMVNVGGFEHSEAVLATELMEQIHPRILIPMHYRTACFGFEQMGTVEEFLVNKKGAHRLDVPFIDIDSNTPGQIAVLKLPMELQA